MQSIPLLGGLDRSEHRHPYRQWCRNTPFFGLITSVVGTVGFVGWIGCPAHQWFPGQYFKLPVVGDHERYANQGMPGTPPMGNRKSMFIVTEGHNAYRGQALQLWWLSQ